MTYSDATQEGSPITLAMSFSNTYYSVALANYFNKSNGSLIYTGYINASTSGFDLLQKREDGSIVTRNSVVYITIGK